MEVEYAIKPRRRRINWRLLLFIAPFAAICGAVLYVVADEVMNKGVHDHGDYVAVELKPLGNFPFNPDADDTTAIPKQFRALDGRRVELEGKMYAGMTAASRVGAFQFVYDVNKCCFGGPPKVQERVFVHSKQPVVLYGPYDLCRLVGKLHVRLERNDQGTVTSVYDLDLEKLNPIQ